MKSLSGKEMARLLEQLGWKLVKVESSHHRYEKPGCAKIIIPIHGNKSLKKGTQHGIMKAAGLTPADLS
jgi:predicted RNA binding protein YcfA (HicA-like mRNA interferase family)